VIAPRLSEAAQAAAGDAAYLRLLGLLFERPRPGWADQIRSLAEETADARLRDLARGALAAGEGDYLALFGPGGAVSPREVGHDRFLDPGRVMADLSGIYNAFAFRPRAEDPIDHVAVEVGFAGFLALKEAYALANGSPEGAGQARRARALFLDTHLRRFAGALRARLVDAGLPHLEGAATLLAEWAGCPDSDAVAGGAATPGGAVAAGGAACGALVDDGTDLDCGGCGAEGPAPS
jgi:hypothetical protein